MKIAIILRDITERGGGERVAVNLANAFLELLSYEVRIISFFKHASSPAFAISPDVRVEYLVNFTERSKNVFVRIFNKHILRIFLNFKARKYYADCDVILANDRALIQGFKMPNKRYIRLWHLDFARKNLNFFDELVILSNRQINKWQSIHSSVSVIENFLSQIPVTQSNRQKKIILAIGRFSPQKDFLGLIDMYAKIAKNYPEWKLRIVGEGVQKKQMQEKIQTLAMRDYIEIYPFMQDISKAYLNASVFVLSSVFEGFAMVLLEASSYGLACVSFDIDAGPSEIVVNGRSGFLISPRDYNKFSSKLEAVLQDENLRHKMGENAAKYVATRFSQERILKKWKNLFEVRKEK